MSDNNLSGKDEALLILEYLENERMSKTFLSFLDESKHLHQLRARLQANYEHAQPTPSDGDVEANEFQTFFNLSKQLASQSSSAESEHQLTFLSNKASNELFFDDDFLNDLISQTPPMDCQADLPETPLIDNDMDSIEQLFAVQHAAPPSHHIVQATCQTLSPPPARAPSYTKCIVVTQDFLQSMYNQQSAIVHSSNSASIQKPRRRRRRLKAGKENHYQQRKIMPRTSPEHR